MSKLLKKLPLVETIIYIDIHIVQNMIKFFFYLFTTTNYD